jgi:hypothetical protein
LKTGQLREVLADWVGERHGVHAVFPSKGGLRSAEGTSTTWPTWRSC